MKWILSISIIALFACSNSKKVDSSKTEVESTDPKTEVTSQELFSEEKVTMTFERSVCFGACPAFKVIIFNDGTCLYEGYKFVDLVGNYSATIDKNLMNSIFDEAKRIGFYDLNDVYDNEAVTDVPTVVIELAGPNGIKKIRNRYEAPQELNDFCKFIDSVVLKLDWQEASPKSED